MIVPAKIANSADSPPCQAFGTIGTIGNRENCGIAPGDDLTVRRLVAERQAYALGIPLYLRDNGSIAQHPPGERIEPAPGAQPMPHAHGSAAEAAAKP